MEKSARQKGENQRGLEQELPPTSVAEARSDPQLLEFADGIVIWTQGTAGGLENLIVTLGTQELIPECRREGGFHGRADRRYLEGEDDRHRVGQGRRRHKAPILAYEGVDGEATQEREGVGHEASLCACRAKAKRDPKPQGGGLVESSGCGEAHICHRSSPGLVREERAPLPEDDLPDPSGHRARDHNVLRCIRRRAGGERRAARAGARRWGIGAKAMAKRESPT